MQITASMVKELRERTGAGMMECKRALTESSGDMEAAVELMRKSGLAQADKKASRIAAEGIITVSVSSDRTAAALVEVNCETDFVAKGEEFKNFAHQVAQRVLRDVPVEVEALGQLPLTDTNDRSIEEERRELVAKIGENIRVRRFDYRASQGGQLGVYVHGGRIGVLVDLQGGDPTLAKDIAMHVAASRPVCVTEGEVPKDLLEKEREIFLAQAEGSGKPANIIEKMVAGRLKKFLAEITLNGQAFVKEPNKTVGELLAQAHANVKGFVRYEVGEGLEKRTENFAEEVMAQVKTSENDG
jgi:elongation factor Ts